MQHDHDYKTIFSHPDMVRDLITAFTPVEWQEGLDFSTLAPYQNEFIVGTKAGVERRSDVVWHLRYRDTQVYVYLLLEFQSSVDPSMALRMLGYVALLYYDLYKKRPAGSKELLPFVLPLVIYNGQSVWRAPLQCDEMIAAPPPGLEAYLPRMRYLLLDEARIADEYLEQLPQNRVAQVFGLETRSTLEGLQKVLQRMLQWPMESEDLRQTLFNIIKRAAGKNLPELDWNELEGIRNLQGMLIMLEESLELIIKNREMAAMSLGEARGRLEGRSEGRLEGKIETLISLLTFRFGELPAATLQTIWNGSPEQVQTWTMRLMQANDLEQVFKMDTH